VTGPASPSRPSRLRTLLLLVLLLAALLALARWREGRATLVAHVLDGDTLVLATGERVRLIGVDAPEIAGLRRLAPQPFGPEAAAFARRLAEGRRIRLEFDLERRDKYGRTLAYVFVGDLDLNAEMIREGYAVAYRQFPHRRYDEFLALEAEARRARRGLWAPSGPRPLNRAR
jgi:micrococcal nuclease